MSNWLSLPVLIVAAILQATFMPQIRIFGGAPDLVFLVVLAWAIHAPLESAVAWAFVGGIVQDLLSAAPTGASTLGFLFVIFSITLLHRQVYGIGAPVLIGLTLVGTLARQVTMMLVLGASGFTLSPVDSFMYVILPTMVYNLAFIAPVYWFVRRLQRRVPREGRALA